MLGSPFFDLYIIKKIIVSFWFFRKIERIKNSPLVNFEYMYCTKWWFVFVPCWFFYLRCTWKRLAPSIRRNNNEFESNKKRKRIFYPHVIKIFFNSFRVVFWFVAFERKLPPCDTKLSSKHSTTFHSLIPTSPSIAISPPIVFSVTTTGLAS